MQWAIDPSRLSPQQERVMDDLIANLKRPQWLRGFAGSGKTVLITLLIERLRAIDPDGSICFLSFTHALKDLVQTGIHESTHGPVVVQTYHQFLRKNRHFTYVFVDEVQDISIDTLKEIQQFATHILVAGDPDQKIYKRGCSEQQLMALLSPSVSKLDEIFRLTETLLKTAVSINPLAANSAVGMDVVGTKDSSVKLVSCVSADVETAWVWMQAKEHAVPGKPSAILFSNHDMIANFAERLARYLGTPEPQGLATGGHQRDYAVFNKFWRTQNVPFMYLGNGQGSLPASDQRPLVYAMTYHSSKGLDFDNVFLPELCRNNRIWGGGGSPDDEKMIRRLLFVAVTRSRSNLFISFSGDRMHRALGDMDRSLVTYLTIDEDSLIDDHDDTGPEIGGWI